MIIEHTGYHPQIERFRGSKVQLGLLHPSVLAEVRKTVPDADESDFVYVSYSAGDWNFVVYGDILYTIFL